MAMLRPDLMVPAHAFGERYELPIPLWLFVVCGALVVLASFLLVLRRSSRGAAQVEVEDTVPTLKLSPVSATASIGLMLSVAFVGMTGTQEVASNIAPLCFWVLAWIGVPLSCGLIGDWTRPWNPFANLARLADNA